MTETTTRALRRAAASLALLAVVAPGARAQSLAQRVAAAADGAVRMSFPARPGVYGDGDGIRWMGGRNATDEWVGACTCSAGPVRVALDVRDRRVVDVRTYVGGEWRSASGGTTELGMVPAPEAADYLLSLVPGLEDSDAGEEAILAAVVADSAVVWPELLELARDRSLPSETRKDAVFWLGQAAADAATAGLESIVGADSEDREVREAAVFALSRRPDDGGVEALIRVVRTNPDPDLKEKALFWLGRSEDPRAIALFEEILTRH